MTTMVRRSGIQYVAWASCVAATSCVAAMVLLLAGCSGDRCSSDTDLDGIADSFEGSGDFDRDGIPNIGDDDSDGDGVPDAEEARSDDICAPADTDADGIVDALDLDSDNDGLPDRTELELGTNPISVDSDGDGVTDLGEVEGTGTDPLDKNDTIDAGDFFVVLPYQGGPSTNTLRFSTNISVADVFFLLDMTSSMHQERSNLVSGLVDTIIPGIEQSVVDVQFGVGGLDDYPVSGYGSPDDRPFYMLREIGSASEDVGAWSVSTETACPSEIGALGDVANGRPDLLEAVEGLPCHHGGDDPESYVPALYATATGEGLEWSGGEVPPRSCAGGGRGYPCFRPDALPIILLFGDNGFHNGPGGIHPYNMVPNSPNFSRATDALNEIGARVLGIFSGGSAAPSRAHFAEIARRTGAVDALERPLVFDINFDGAGLDVTVVEAVSRLVGSTPQDVSTSTENLPGNEGDFDATQFIRAITPVTGVRDGRPGEGFSGADDTTFRDVIPGTQVDFQITFENTVQPPTDRARIFRARIKVTGNRVAFLDAHDVYIIVPPDGWTILL